MYVYDYLYECIQPSNIITSFIYKLICILYMLAELNYHLARLHSRYTSKWCVR